MKWNLALWPRGALIGPATEVFGPFFTALWKWVKATSESGSPESGAHTDNHSLQPAYPAGGREISPLFWQGGGYTFHIGISCPVFKERRKIPPYLSNNTGTTACHQWETVTASNSSPRNFGSKQPSSKSLQKPNTKLTFPLSLGTGLSFALLSLPRIAMPPLFSNKLILLVK